MPLPEFEYLEPESVARACELLSADPGGSVLMAGGTDVLVGLHEGTAAPRRLVSLRRIPSLSGVSCAAGGGLAIQALATVGQVARDRAIARLYPGLADAARALADEQIRNLATVCGNICSAVPSADLAPVLLALGARARLASRAGERSVPLHEFFLGPRRTALAPAEVMVALEAPPPEPGSGSASIRLGGREALSLPHAIAAAVVAMDGDVCRRATIAVGAVAPTPMVAARASASLAGARLAAEALEEAGALAAEESRPIDDLRAGKAYRLELVAVLVRRAVALAARRAGGG